jgi:hypothetical protein
MVQQEVGQERGEQGVAMEWINVARSVERTADTHERGAVDSMQQTHRMLSATQRVSGNRIGRHSHDSCEVFEGHVVHFVEYTTE